jgi:DTW domain-containing protein
MAECPQCGKQTELCLCDTIAPLQTRLHVLILQHPQEPDKDLGSARIAHLALANSTLRIGLSWPNLSKALGRPAIHANWGILYLGGKSEKAQVEPNAAQRFRVISKPGGAQETPELALEGIVVLDGTWAQAKTMWWRNPWLLKLKRIVLKPSRPSLYGRLRQEPRRECLSTIEAIAEALDALGEDAVVGNTLRAHFAALLQRYRNRVAGPGRRPG